MAASRRRVVMGVLRGEPLDGTGRVAIHLFLEDAAGPFVEPNVLHPAPGDGKKLVARPTRGRLACDPRRTVAPVIRGTTHTVTVRTAEPRAVTCTRCMDTAEYGELMAKLQGV